MTAKNARASMLSKIRNSLGVTPQDRVRRETVQQRLSRHPAGIIPRRACGSREENVTLFTSMLDGQAATVARVKGAHEIPEAVSRYLRATNLRAEVRHGDDAFLSNLPWSKTPHIERLIGPALADDAVGLSHACAAAAETGTLFLASGPDNPTTLNFLPETHIIVIRSDDLVGSYEDAWARLRDVYGPGKLPRAVNLISGPSRTADIEQTIVLGAHGPKRLHVVLAGS